jgi:signal transduction histidine kinase
VLPAALLAGLAGVVAFDQSSPVPVAPPAASFILAIITLATGFVVRYLWQRSEIDGATVQSLPDPLFALYLAVVVLTGVRVAVVLAVLTPMLVRIPDMLRQPERLRVAVREAAGAGITTLAAGVIYLTVGGVSAPRFAPFRGHFLGAVAASAVMVLGIACMRGLEDAARGMPFGRAVLAYFRSPTLRFQVLILSICPLLPLAEVLDDVEAEFAWILFFVPLCAVYYLALVSARLQQRTDELQVTVEQLGVSRRREAELLDYAALVTHAQEDERRRLARELHDDTAQALIALSRGLDTLAVRQVEPPLSTHDTHFIGELGELAKRTLDSVRRACQDLRPSVLDDLGLAAALESLAHSVTKRGLRCAFRGEGTTRSCPPEIEVTIYRIAQEALSNAVQHAHASEATLTIVYLPTRIQVHVEDNGLGFDYAGVVRSHSTLSRDEQELRPGLGLMGMRERASLIGARLQVQSDPEHGTTVSLDVPLGSKSAATA